MVITAIASTLLMVQFSITKNGYNESRYFHRVTDDRQLHTFNTVNRVAGSSRVKRCTSDAWRPLCELSMSDSGLVCHTHSDWSLTSASTGRGSSYTEISSPDGRVVDTRPTRACLDGDERVRRQ